MQATLVGTAVPAIFLWLIAVRWSGLKCTDLGVSRGKFASAIALTAVLWTATNIVHAAIALSQGESLVWNSEWQSPGARVLLGSLIAQLFGNALIEEMTYRHLLASQFRARLTYVKQEGLRMALVLLVSQCLFALVHIPQRLSIGMEVTNLPGEMIYLTVLGLLFAWGYIQTRNLFFVVGWHSLMNEPTLLVKQAGNPIYIICGVVIIALLLSGSVAWVRRIDKKRSE